MSLILHCGSRLVEKENVFDVETPESTPTHQPIPHKFLIEEIECAIEGADLAINDQAHALDKDGNKYFGMYEITSQEGTLPEDDTSLILGARHSHDKSLSVGVCLGQKVFVCDNLAFSGEIKFFRKHTKDVEVDVINGLNSAFDKIPEMHKRQKEMFECFKKEQLKQDRARSIIVEGAKRGVIPGTRIIDVVKEWEKPTYPEFKEWGDSMYRLHNAFTTVMKTSNKNIFTLPQKTMILQDLVKSAMIGFAA